MRSDGKLLKARVACSFIILTTVPMCNRPIKNEQSSNQQNGSESSTEIDIKAIGIGTTAEPTVMDAAKKGDLHSLRRLLQDDPSGARTRNNHGESALMLAARNGHEEAASMLITSGDDVNVQDDLGKSALRRAIEGGHEKIMLLLLSRGAKVNQRAVDGTTALHGAVLNGNENIVRLLLNHGADLTARDAKGAAPLLYAASSGYKAVAELLITYGANVNDQNDAGLSPLHVATRDDHVEVIDLLIRYGAVVNKVDRRGNTALHWAARNRRIDAARRLIAHHARALVINNNGKSPMDMTFNKELMKLLWTATTVPQESADQQREPLRWRMLKASGISMKAPIPRGQSTLSITNSKDSLVLVLCKCPGQTGRFFIEPGERVQYYLKSNRYEIYLIFDDQPNEVYRGQDVNLRLPYSDTMVFSGVSIDIGGKGGYRYYRTR